MYIVYIINYQTYDVKVKSIVKDEKLAIEKMKELALNFMAHEEGKRKARIITETPFDASDIVKGYILFSPDPKKIDVYYKDIVESESMIWGIVQETKLNKVKAYSYSKVYDEKDREDREDREGDSDNSENESEIDNNFI